MSSDKSLQDLIKELPPDIESRVKKYAELLLHNKKSTGQKLRQDWGGALKEYRAKYTALQLQSKAIEWRSS